MAGTPSAIGRAAGPTVPHHRGPRTLASPVPADPIEVRLPAPKDDGGGRILRALQIVAPVAGAGTGLVYVLVGRGGDRLITIIMGAAIGSLVLIGVATAAAQAHVARRKRRFARRRYLQYLDGVEDAIVSLLEAQQKREAILYPDPDELLALAIQRQRVWERRPADADWLDARLGRGAIPPPMPVRMQAEDPLGPELPPDLLDSGRELVARYAVRPDAPLALPLRRAGTIAVGGDAGAARGLLRWLVVQAAALHDPDDLAVAVIGEDADAEQAWDWVKWLPHARRDRLGDGLEVVARDANFAASPGGAGGLLRELLGPRAELDGRARGAAGLVGGGAHLLLVVDRFRAASPLARIGPLVAAMSHGPEIGVTVLCHVAPDADEPGDLQVRLRVGTDGRALLEHPGEPGRRPVEFAAEQVPVGVARAIARRISPLRVARPDPSEGARPAREASRLVDALGFTDAGRLDIGAAWRRAEATLLRVPIGRSARGETLVVDLKEFSQGGMGPHGMLIGAPGAGKSELLRTMVAGLAATHPPELLCFVLVDFKGGATFQPLAGLPHVAGMVTNLEDDRTMVERFRLAIEGEVLRRQEIFREAGVADIRGYHLSRRDDPRLPPLPYLWLVVDEFAELLSGFPDFDAFFEGVVRLGRALGVHVLLATQGLASGLHRLDRYISFRLCMRTNSLQESIAVMQSPAAAQLPLVPGFGFLKVGQTEADQFRAFLVSAAPRALAGAGAGAPPAVHAFRLRGSWEPATVEAGNETGTGLDPDRTAAPETTELTAIVGRIAELGAAPAHRVWVTPLPRALALSAVVEPGGTLRVGLGLADHPLRQAQRRWVADFAGPEGHLAIVGAPRSGRTTALRTLIASFVVTHEPRDVTFYCVDMGGGLAPLADTPHVAMVAGKNDPDHVRRCIRMLRSLADERAAEMRRLGVGTIAEWRMRRRNNLIGGDAGDCFLVIDNWAAATSAFGHLEEDVVGLAGIGLSHGIHVVLTADRWQDVRPALRDRVAGRIQLRPIEAGDSIFDARTTRGLPARVPGRALVAGGVQMQLALPRMDGRDTLEGADEALRELVRRHAVPGRPAPPVRLLPDLVPLATLEVAGPGHDGVPVGIADADLRPVWLDLLSRDVQHLLVTGDSRCGKTSFLRALMQALTRAHSPDRLMLALVDVRRGLLDAVAEEHVAAHAMSIAGIDEVVAALKEALRKRVPPPGASRQELLERRHIPGPELVLVVDDEDIIDSPALASITQAVPVAWDMKFHVVLARRSVTPAFESLGGALVKAGGAGLAMSEADRSIFLTRPQVLPPGRAHLLVRGGAPRLLQLIHPSGP